MLNDVFVIRYENTPLWSSFGELERRFLVQAAKIITEQLLPEIVDGETSLVNQAALERVHSKLSMEIGIDPLSPTHAQYTGLKIGLRERTVSFFTRVLQEGENVDVYLKTRISFVELALREKASLVDSDNKRLPFGTSLDKPVILAPNLLHSLQQMTKKIEDERISKNAELNKKFDDDIHEFNVRFQQAKLSLVYHSDFIHLSGDGFVEANVSAPFWSLIADEKWRNVEHDMHEAIDRRDNSGRDPAFYAAKALESTIKIISKEKGWTRGKESGASNYIDNLVSQTNGRFIEPWEADTLKAFFSKVRNPLGHGAGGEDVPSLTTHQDSWAIETCMSWIKSLIHRM